MTFTPIVVGFLAVATLAANKQAVAANHNWGSAGDWGIGWDDGDSSCTARGVYDGGMEVLMRVTDTQGFLLLSDKSWSFIKQDKIYQLETVFDGRRSWGGEVTGRVYDDGTYGFVVNGALEYMIEIARSRTVRLFIEDGGRKRLLTGLTLKGTSDALKATIACSEALAANSGSQQASTTRSETEEKGKSGSSSGTGIVVSKAGHVLTNYHVIQGCSSVKVMRVGDIAKPADVLRTDVTNDLAILRTNQEYHGATVARFRIGPSAKPGESIAVYGYPLAGALSLSGNIVAGNITSLSGLADDVRFLQISAPVQPGNSGGPLLDSSGSVIGVVSSQISEVAVAQRTGAIPQNVNFALKGTVAMNFLEVHSIPFEISSNSFSGGPLQLTDIADEAKGFTVLVSCP